jgi:hypothetical protein
LGASQVHRWLVYLLVLATPFSIYPALVLAGRGVKPFHAIAVLIGVLGLLRIAVARVPIRLTPVTKGALAFEAVASLSLAGFAVAGPTFPGLFDFATVWIQLTIVVLLVVGVSTLNFERSHVRRLVWILLATATAVSVYAIYQAFARMYGLPLAYLDILNPTLAGRASQGAGAFGPFVRPSAFFTEPSRLGAFLLTPLLVSWSLLVSSARFGPTERRVLEAAFALILAAFVLAFSMGAYLALGGAVLLGLIFVPTREAAAKFLVVGTGALVTLSVILYPILDEFLAKIIAVRALAHLEPLLGLGAVESSPFAGTSVSPRLARLEAGLGVWMAYPLLGVGINNFGRYFPADVAPRIHSAFVQAMAEMGFMGAVTLAILVILAIVSILRTATSLGKGDPLGPIAGAVGIAVAGRGIYMVVAMGYLIEFFWLDLVLAAVLVGARGQRFQMWGGVSE